MGTRPIPALRAAVAAMLLLSAPGLRAHGLGVWAETTEDDRVLVEATWSTAKPAAGARVIVLAADGSELLTGRTGEDGRFRFGPPTGAAWPLEIRVDADDDHRGRFVLEAGRAAKSTGHGHDEGHHVRPERGHHGH